MSSRSGYILKLDEKHPAGTEIHLRLHLGAKPVEVPLKVSGIKVELN